LSLPDEYSQERYLFAKRTVDDRALNRGVLERLNALLTETGRERHGIVELGAGVGTMVSRLVDWGVVASADYRLLDRDARSLEAARRALESWSGVPVATGGVLCVARGEAKLEITFEHGDALQFVGAASSRRRFDLVVANAVVDLMNLDEALTGIFECLVPGGACSSWSSPASRWGS
jgi:SAM-dependent methyltransferase